MQPVSVNTSTFYQFPSCDKIALALPDTKKMRVISQHFGHAQHIDIESIRNRVLNVLLEKNSDDLGESLNLAERVTMNLVSLAKINSHAETQTQCDEEELVPTEEAKPINSAEFYEFPSSEKIALALPNIKEANAISQEFRYSQHYNLTYIQIGLLLSLLPSNPNSNDGNYSVDLNKIIQLSNRLTQLATIKRNVQS